MVSNISVVNDSLFLTNELYEAEIVPSLGGKIKSLKSLRTDREFFYQDQRTKQGKAGYESFDISGWDECFPNIRPCIYPVPPYEGRSLPDHGFLWSYNCEWDIREKEIVLKADFKDYCVSFERRIRFSEISHFVCDYKLTNYGNHHFIYLTDAHIAFAWEKDFEISFADKIDNFYVYRSLNNDFPKEGEWINNYFWKEERKNYSCKVFTPQLKDGKIEFIYGSDTKQKEKVTLTFPSDLLSYAGLWIAKEWYDDDQNKIHCFSVQPTNFASATLPEKEWCGLCPVIMPGETKEWFVSIKIE